MKTPDPLIWIPEDFDDQKVIKGRILNATFFPEEGYIGIKLKLDDGSVRAAYMHKSSVTFRGKPWTEIPADEVNREMKKTTDSFNKAQGKYIKLQAYKHQLNME